MLQITNTYRNQSIARIKDTSSVGKPTAVNTMVIVTSPADGIPAAPMAAAVAVKLKRVGEKITNVIREF